MFVVTARATTFASAQAESMAAMRATLARTAMIFAARSDPRAIVLTDTNARPFQYLGFYRFSIRNMPTRSGKEAISQMHDSSKSVSADYADYTDKVEKEQGQQAGAGRKGSFSLHLLLPLLPLLAHVFLLSP
jgi:hypothetical protein